MLGVKELCLHDLPDNRFDTVPLLDIIKTRGDLISRLELAREGGFWISGRLGEGEQKKDRREQVK